MRNTWKVREHHQINADDYHENWPIKEVDKWSNLRVEFPAERYDRGQKWDWKAKKDSVDVIRRGFRSQRVVIIWNSQSLQEQFAEGVGEHHHGHTQKRERHEANLRVTLATRFLSLTLYQIQANREQLHTIIIIRQIYLNIHNCVLDTNFIILPWQI